VGGINNSIVKTRSMKNNITRMTYSANGNVSFKGVGVINKVTHTGDYGDINFVGGGGGNIITRSGLKEMRHCH
jgi:hypothetical protein